MNCFFFMAHFLLIRLQFVYLLLQVDDVEGQFFDLLQQQFVHLTHVHTLFFHLLGRRNVGQTAVKMVFFITLMFKMLILIIANIHFFVNNTFFSLTFFCASI